MLLREWENAQGKRERDGGGREEEDCVFSSFRKYAYPLARGSSQLYMSMQPAKFSLTLYYNSSSWLALEWRTDPTRACAGWLMLMKRSSTLQNNREELQSVAAMNGASFLCRCAHHLMAMTRLPSCSTS